MRNIHSVLRLFALMPLLFTLTGCPGISYTEVDKELGQTSWENILNLDARARENSGPYNASLSFRLRTPEESLMLGAYVWSNGRPSGHYPLRLDLQSSVGSSVAKIKEEADSFLLYDLKNNTAMFSKSPQDALSYIGLPLPFSLSDISMLINGRYLFFFGQNGNTPPRLSATTENMRSIFQIDDGPRRGLLTLNSRGYPVEWLADDGKTGWSMSMTYQDASALADPEAPLPGPSRLNFSHPDGYAVSITVKNLKKLHTPFTPAQLELLIPLSAKVRELTEQFKRN